MLQSRLWSDNVVVEQAMLKLKRSELLDKKGLRRLCRLRAYDVHECNGKKVVLTCVRHSHWDDTQLRVLADTAECPKCGKTRPHGSRSFSSEEWREVLANIQPSIKYVDKSKVVEGRTLFSHRCKKCKAKFKNSMTALLHSRFKCPECEYQMPESKMKKARLYRANLRIKHKREAKERDALYRLSDLKAAYLVLKKLGVVKYPPQIDLPAVVEPTTSNKPRVKEPAIDMFAPTPTNVDEEEELLSIVDDDLDDLLVKELKVRVVNGDEEQTLNIVDDQQQDSDHELALDNDSSYSTDADEFYGIDSYGTPSTVAVYLGRGGVRSSVNNIREAELLAKEINRMNNG